jgi:fumarate reductase flavoprotein subunit
MWERVGLVRDGEGLQQALAEIDGLAARLDSAGVPGAPSFNIAWQDWLNLGNQLVTARLIAASALERRESRGAHFRRDHPTTAAGPLYTVRVAARDGAAAVWTEPVTFTRATPPAAAAPAMVEIGD